jgi:hypothetical protein
LRRIEISIAPATVIKMLSHFKYPRDSPRSGTARIATKIGKVLTTGIILDTSWERMACNMSSRPNERVKPEPIATRIGVALTPSGMGKRYRINSPNPS